MAGDINKAFAWIKAECEKPNVGYWQAHREAETINGITYYDCSSLIWYALKYAGFPVSGSWAMTTENEPSVLVGLGFTEYQITGNEERKPGDILWRRTNKGGHTEMVYQGGIGTSVTMGAHGRTGAYENLADQVSVKGYSEAGSWMRGYRYGSGASGGGYTSNAYVVAAILGNWYQESNVNPGVWQSLSAGTWTDLLKGFGLGQWTNTGGDTHGRLYQLHEWLSANGYADDDGNGQLAYFMHEGVWYRTTSHGTSAYASLAEFLASDSTDLAALTREFMLHWESIDDGSYNTRYTWALRIYDYITEHMGETASWISGNRYLSQTESLNNALAVANFLLLSGGAPTEPDIHKTRVKLLALRSPALYRRR